MINQNNYTIWIQQPLLKADSLWVEHLLWDYGVELHQEGDKIEVAFQPLPLADIMVYVQMVHYEPGKASFKEEASQESYPTFGSHPNNQVTDFNFEKEV